MNCNLARGHRKAGQLHKHLLKKFVNVTFLMVFVMRRVALQIVVFPVLDSTAIKTADLKIIGLLLEK